MEEFSFSLTVNNADLTKRNVREALAVALEEVGMLAERYAKMLCPVDTGNLRNSITHTVDGENLVAYLGTPVEYAPYVEMGTIKMRAQPYIRPAFENHMEEYKDVLEKRLSTVI